MFSLVSKNVSWDENCHQKVTARAVGWTAHREKPVLLQRDGSGLGTAAQASGG
jgi:hypothetical protein